MAYTPSTLDYVYGGPIEGAWKLWVYRTTDTSAAVLAANYISDVNSGTTGGLPTGNKHAMAVGDTVFVINSATPYMLVTQVSAIGASGATLVSGTKSIITDGSLGVASFSGAVIPTLANQSVAFYTALSTLANSQLIAIDFACSGKVTNAFFRTKVAATTAAKAATCSAMINAVNLTVGGVISLTSAACNATGSLVAGTGVTAQAFSNSAIGFNVSGVTAFVEGDGYLVLQYVNQDLLNTVATLIQGS